MRVLLSVLAGAAMFAAADARADEMRCASNAGGYKYCRGKIWGGVSLLVRHSRFVCNADDTWGFDGNGVWVANGCSATFHVGEPPPRESDDFSAALGFDRLALTALGIQVPVQAQRARRNAPVAPLYTPSPDAKTVAQEAAPLRVRCEPIRREKSRCDVTVPNDVQLTRQISKGRGTCRFNHSWGYDPRGIWVDKACRAEFTVR